MDENINTYSSETQTPDRYTDSFINDAGDVKITVDAGINITDTSLPVVRVRPHEITSQETDHWADVLFGDYPVYEPTSVLTKSELEQKILYFRQLASDKDSLMSEYENETDVQSMIDYYNEQAAAFEQMYEDVDGYCWETDMNLCMLNAVDGSVINTLLGYKDL